MTILEQMLEGTKSVAILGHIRPDGDCLGSTLGLQSATRLTVNAMSSASAWTAAISSVWVILNITWTRLTKACAWTIT